MTEIDPVNEQTPDASADWVKRLEKVEHENRRLRRTGHAILVGFAVLLAAGAATPVIFRDRPTIKDVVEARSFALRDSQGRVRGVFGMSQDGSPQFLLQDEGGAARLRLTVLDDGSPGLSLIDSKGRSRAALGLLPDETITLAFADPNGTTRAVLGFTAAEGASLALADSVGATRAGLGVSSDGKATVTAP
jgi:hypothetical protein